MTAAVAPGSLQLAMHACMLLRVRRLREDDLALGKLSETALADIVSDLRRGVPARTAEAGPSAHSLEGYSRFDLIARLLVNLRLRSVDEVGLLADVGRLTSAETARAMLIDTLASSV